MRTTDRSRLHDDETHVEDLVDVGTRRGVVDHGHGGRAHHVVNGLDNGGHFLWGECSTVKW